VVALEDWVRQPLRLARKARRSNAKKVNRRRRFARCVERPSSAGCSSA